MKRILTPEQIAKRDERRANFRKLVKQVGAISDEEKAQFSNRIGAIATADGGVISGLTNTMLLCMQLPSVTMVGGFRQWLKVGRCVTKGQHGAMIWVPTGSKKAQAETAPDQGNETESGERAGFIIGTVFDISQTHEIETDESASQVESQPELQAA